MLVCYTGGGTLGHVLPALAVHEVLARTDGYRCFWIGRKDDAEREAVERAGIRFFPIESGKFRRYFSVKNLVDCFRLAVAFFQALSVLRRMRPDVIFSKGGFVSVPPVYAGRLLGIPVVTHESDASCGLATRLIAPVASAVCLGYESAGADIAEAKRRLTGNPVRASLAGRQGISVRARFGIPPETPLLFVMGGSQGAAQINDLVWKNQDALCEKAFVFHQCGKHDLSGVGHANYHAVESVGTGLMGALYRESDLVVSRGGAGSLSELAWFGCPSVIVPLSRGASRGDQLDNAAMLERRGAAVVLGGQVDARLFLDTVLDLLENKEKRGILARKLHETAMVDSASRIASIVRSEAMRENKEKKL
jgi:UDP-N-acetylglucosamine--N-acetylmuramyl-(pentapeptide) pyrophosphoryl-undecaprenol N-acetylglucosamine transferase